MYSNAAVKDLIALAKILDYYEEFNDALYGISAGTTMSAGEEKKKLYRLLNCIDNKKSLWIDEYTKKFCKDWKSVIDIIRENTSLRTFFQHCHELEEYYYYFWGNKEHISDIISLLERMNELHITSVRLQGIYDFVREEDKTISTDINKVSHITYYENTHFYPSQETTFIKYKALKSNYKIELENKKRNMIEVGNLLFDPKTLPESIDWEYLFNLIMDNYKKQVDSQRIALKKAIQLSSAIDAANVACEELINTFNKAYEAISDVETKEELRQRLLTIKELMSYFANYSKEYDKDVIANNPNITKELLAQERSNIKR